jgi:hypothetical protein
VSAPVSGVSHFVVDHPVPAFTKIITVSEENMGTHTADSSKLREAWYWAVAHRRKILSGAVVALPVVARFVPDFPSDEILSVLRGFLGA